MANIVEHFFPQLKYVPVYTQFMGDKFPDSTKSYIIHEPLLVRTYLKKFFFTPEEKDGKGLAEGYSSSPILFNLYAEFVIDQPLRQYCERHNITYTRFGDNLTFSSDHPIGRKKRKKILNIVRKNGFVVNEKKTLSFNLNNLKEGKQINGVGVRNRGQQADMFMTGKKRRRLQALLHRAIKNKPVNHSEIEGLMGLFKSSTKNSRSLPEFTKAELKIFKMYKEFKKAIRQAKRIQKRLEEKRWLMSIRERHAKGEI